jgi:sulfopyruvate decarboxylase subunit alpha
VVNVLEEEGLDFLVSVPCFLLKEIIEIVDKNKFFKHVPATREEEGIGICAGAALAGKIPVMLIQNSGLGNSINALASLTSYYELPLILLVSHRGTKGETINAQFPMGAASPKLLESIGLDYCIIWKSNDVDKLRQIIKKTVKTKTQLAVFLPFSFFEVHQ